MLTCPDDFDESCRTKNQKKTSLIRVPEKAAGRAPYLALHVGSVKCSLAFPPHPFPSSLSRGLSADGDETNSDIRNALCWLGLPGGNISEYEFEKMLVVQRRNEGKSAGTFFFFDFWLVM